MVKPDEQAAYKAYGVNHRNGLRGRALEAHAFAHAVHLLQMAQDDSRNPYKRADALRYVQQLWTALQAGLDKGRSPLAKDTQKKMQDLAKQVQGLCRQMVSKPDGNILRSLIQIHHDLMQGLSE